MFSVVLPIDRTILTAGEKMIAALSIALADSIISFLITLYAYSIQFIQQPVLNFCILAADTNHATTEPATDMQTY